MDLIQFGFKLSHCDWQNSVSNLLDKIIGCDWISETLAWNLSVILFCQSTTDYETVGHTCVMEQVTQISEPVKFQVHVFGRLTLSPFRWID